MLNIKKSKPAPKPEPKPTLTPEQKACRDNDPDYLAKVHERYRG